MKSMSSDDSTPSDKVRPAVRLSRPVIEVDVNRHLAEIRAGDAYHGADHAAETLMKEPGLRLVLIALKDGGHMNDHRAHTSITVQVVEGMVRFEVGGRIIQLTPGLVLAVDADMPHRLEAVGDSAVLLTMGGQ
jgi:quercetin dioxygenase-like cupin family protein